MKNVMIALARVLPVALGVGLTAGCPGKDLASSDPVDCTSDEDCDPDEQCLDCTCEPRTQCQTDLDCVSAFDSMSIPRPEGHVVGPGTCEVVIGDSIRAYDWVESAERCTTPATCPEGEDCINGYCARLVPATCDPIDLNATYSPDDRDCVVDQLCLVGHCFESVVMEFCWGDAVISRTLEPSGYDPDEGGECRLDPPLPELPDGLSCQIPMGGMVGMCDIDDRLMRPCLINRDCLRNQVCVDGICHSANPVAGTSCQTNEDCTTNPDPPTDCTICVGNECQIPASATIGSRCEGEGDCLSNERCVDQVCQYDCSRSARPLCGEDTECGSNIGACTICIEGSCRQPWSSGPCLDQADCWSDERCIDGRCQYNCPESDPVLFCGGDEDCR